MIRQEIYLHRLQNKVYSHYDRGLYGEALHVAEEIYHIDAARTDNLLALGAISFQLRNFSEAVFYNQQALRVEPLLAEACSNLANALKELGDVRGALQWFAVLYYLFICSDFSWRRRFYLKAIKHKPRFGDAYNNLASTYAQLGQINDAIETYQMALVIDSKLVDAHCNLGNLFKAQGRRDTARKCYLEAIRLNPEFAIAWSNLAGMFKDEGQLSTAIAYYREAIRLCPPFADVYSNLGSAMQDQGNLLEANMCYQTAIQLRPDFAVAYGNLGSSLLASGDAMRAMDALRYAIQLEPNFPDAYDNLGSALRVLRQPLSLDAAPAGAHKERAKFKVHDHEPIACFRKALRLKSDHINAYSNLACALHDRGLVREAIHCSVTAARLMPLFAPAHINLGSLLRGVGQLDQALAHYHQAIALDPSFAEAHTNLGNTYYELRQLDDAMKCYNTALIMSPSLAEAHAGLAAVYDNEGDYHDAIACYERALNHKPLLPQAHVGLARAKCSICDWTTRDMELRCLSAILEAQLASDEYDDSILDAMAAVTHDDGSLPEMTVGACQSNLPAFYGRLPCIQPVDAMSFATVVSPRDMQRLTRRFAARARASLCLLVLDPFNYRHLRSTEDKRIKIGYLCANFGELAMMPLLQFHNRSRFFVICYSLTPSTGTKWCTRFESSIEGGIKDLSLLSSSDAARIINSDGVQILFGLDGHTANSNNGVLALRPAPIQAGFVLGFCATWGADYIDYLVADRIVLGLSSQQIDAPHDPGTQLNIDERVLLLPNSCILNAHALVHTDLRWKSNLNRKNFDLPDDAWVFAYLGSSSKIDPIIFGVWMSILKRVPNSVLWLCNLPEPAIPHLMNEACDYQIEEKRICFSQRAPGHKSIHQSVLADLILDTPCCNMLESTIDALWTGTPVVTFLGSTIATRISASLCNAANCPELITESLEDYEHLAVELAVDGDKYFSLRQRLEESRTGTWQAPLFNFKENLAHFEVGCEAIWARALLHKPPANTTVVV